MRYLALLLPFCTGCLWDAQYRNYGEPWSQMTLGQNAMWTTALIMLGIVLGLLFFSRDK